MSNYSKGKSFAISVGLSLLTVMMFLAALEILLVIKYNKWHGALVEKYENRDFCTTRSAYPELIYTLIPDKCDSNSHGYRDDNHEYAKSEGVSRIVIIGDSVAQGQGVEHAQRYGEVLETLLNESLGGEGREFEVIILAQSGYSTAQELFLLENEAFRYSPNLVIWSYVLNDPAHPLFHNANGELGRYFHKPRWHTPHWVSRKLFEINENQQREICPEEYHAFLHCAYRDQIAAHIAQIGQSARDSGVDFIFAIHPVFERGGEYDDYSLAPVHAQLRQDADSAGLAVVDLLDDYQAYSTHDLKQPVAGGHDPWHPNERGNRVAAEQLYRFIGEGNYFGGVTAAQHAQ